MLYFSGWRLLCLLRETMRDNEFISNYMKVKDTVDDLIRPLNGFHEYFCLRGSATMAEHAYIDVYSGEILT